MMEPLEIEKGQELTLEVESLSGDGTAVARYHGLVCFVEHAVPGDTVRARVFRAKKSFLEARTLEILKPSPLRVEPRCIHFGVCGGCKWQDLGYPSQLDAKRQRVVDAFERIGGFKSPDVQPVLGCDEPYYYRNKMEFTFSNSRWLSDEEMAAGAEPAPQVCLGLHVPQRYDKVVDLQECWLQSETSAAIVNTLREVSRGWQLTVYSTETQEGYLRHLVIKEAKHTGEMMVNLVTSTHWPDAMERLSKLLLEHFPMITTIVNNVTARRSMVAVGEEERIYHGPGYITETLGGRTFRISANSFFQTNTLQAERLYTVARELASLRSDDVVYDLYSGTGTIAIFVADAVERVVGIEVVESAIADAQRNAEVNHVANCYFIKGDLKDRVTRDRGWMQEHPKPTVVIADPPRNGMHDKVVREIIGWHPSRIVYVSCNPSTQARDAKLFLEGGYRLEKIQPVDMFPHTDHIEAVALFTSA